MSLAIDVLEPSALLIVCLVLDGALLTRLRGVKPGIGGAANVRFWLGIRGARNGRKADTQDGRSRPSHRLRTWTQVVHFAASSATAAASRDSSLFAQGTFCKIVPEPKRHSPVGASSTLIFG